MAAHEMKVGTINSDAINGNTAVQIQSASGVHQYVSVGFLVEVEKVEKQSEIKHHIKRQAIEVLERALHAMKEYDPSSKD